MHSKKFYVIAAGSSRRTTRPLESSVSETPRSGRILAQWELLQEKPVNLTELILKKIARRDELAQFYWSTLPGWQRSEIIQASEKIAFDLEQSKRMKNYIASTEPQSPPEGVKTGETNAT